MATRYMKTINRQAARSHRRYCAGVEARIQAEMLASSCDYKAAEKVVTARDWLELDAERKSFNEMHTAALNLMMQTLSE